MIFKIDFEKAYDKVRWDFFEILKGKGFPDMWTNWIMQLLGMARFASMQMVLEVHISEP